MPSTSKALQAAWDIMSMPVPGALPVLAPRSRGKPPLGSPQSPPAQYQSRSRERSRHRPATVQGSVHVDRPRHQPDCLDGCRPTGTPSIAHLRKENIDGTMVDVANSPSLAGDTTVLLGEKLPAPVDVANTRTYCGIDMSNASRRTRLTEKKNDF
ncbi:hypothetical protein UY3_03724 [Chelonia mydas]|uniref:Uncharacterized protein n=1 Tax=Chelonia mydas TaxID=8469 RepID=M7BTG3_CHEMY|nr:hypothetical protein UY3_03724 [Chelonia mydas]